MTAKTMTRHDTACELFAALLKAPRTTGELCEMTGLAWDAVTKWLDAMQRSGLVVQLGERTAARGTPAKVFELCPYPFLQREPAFTGPVKRVYVAGPMAGMPELNFPAFNKAAKSLRSFGVEVVNPAELNVGIEGNWAACMRNDVRELVTCDTLALLPGWERSRGAQVENRLARDLGMRVVTIEALLLHMGSN